MSPSTATTTALKEWSAAVHALLDGRQTVLLRKGGIHERAFSVEADRFLLFPTVAHSHAERVRSGNDDVLASGVRDVNADADTFMVRAGVTLVGAVDVVNPGGLGEIADLHIWTAQSVQTDRLDFRPRKALQVLVVRALALPEPLELARVDAYAGCRSWVDLPVEWDPANSRQVQDEARLATDLARVRAAVGK